MSSPREAVYDVILARQRRAQDETRHQLDTAWQEYTASNARASEAYHNPRSSYATRATRMRDTRNLDMRESVIRVEPSTPNDGPTPKEQPQPMHREHP